MLLLYVSLPQLLTVNYVIMLPSTSMIPRQFYKNILADRLHFEDVSHEVTWLKGENISRYCRNSILYHLGRKTQRDGTRDLLDIIRFLVKIWRRRFEVLTARIFSEIHPIPTELASPRCY